MDFLGIQITQEQIDQWLASARDFALPRALQTIGQMVLGIVLFLILRWILKRIQHSFAAKTATKVDDHIIQAAQRAASISVIGWVLWRSGHIWELQGLSDFVAAGWIIALSLPIAELVSKLLAVVEEELVSKTETTLDDTALPLLNKVARTLVVAGGVITALAYLNINIVPFIAGASVLGVAIGFAAKDTLSNLIAGVLLILDRPFHVGDRIELWTAPNGTGTWGDVIEIGLRATKIRNPDNLVFVIPNNQIMQRDIVNYTASGDNIRLRIPISIAYDADPAKAKEIIREVALRTEGVMEDPEPQIIIRNFGESAVDLQLRVWIADARKRRTIGDEITDKVKGEFDRAGVEIPYAKRDLYIRAMPDATGSPAAGASAAQPLPAPPGTTPEKTRSAAPETRGGTDDRSD